MSISRREKLAAEKDIIIKKRPISRIIRSARTFDVGPSNSLRKA